PPGLVGGVDVDVAVEAAGPGESGVEDVGAVRRGEHHDPFGTGEAVHLGEDLVEGLLAFVVPADRPGAAAGPPDRVDLVDEDDRGRDLAGLFEEFPDPARPDPDDRSEERRVGKERTPRW